MLTSGQYSVPNAWRIRVNIPYSVDFRIDLCSVNLKPVFQIYIIDARVFGNTCDGDYNSSPSDTSSDIVFAELFDSVSD